MPHLRCMGVNDAFNTLVQEFAIDPFEPSDIAKTKNSSRVGNVIQAVEPVIVTYLEPRQRVLFNQARDANPFMSLFESLWMLDGRRDIAPITYYSAKYPEFVQDGEHPYANGAYGWRWRHAISNGVKEPSKEIQWADIGWDQLKAIVQHFKKNPNSRRAVLQMWNPINDLLQAGGIEYLKDKEAYSKDICCNLCCTFLVNNGRLDMTVFNRSNDLILGMLGANVVHFSFLLEYMAAHIGVDMGVYNQVTNNLHVYESNFKPTEWLSDTTPNYYSRVPRINGVNLVYKPEQFDKELKQFNQDVLGQETVTSSCYYREPFFTGVALPMGLAFSNYKKKQFKLANKWASEIIADDWRIACVNWLRKREARYNRASDDGVNYEDNRNPYLESHLRKESANVGTQPKEE